MNQRELFYNFIAQTSDSPLALEIESAKGIYLFDKSGKKYTDLISGISVSNIGHTHPKVVEAIKNQADKYLHLMVYGEYIQNPQVILAKNLCNLLPENLNSVYFVNSGSEAVEGALKLAKRFNRRTEIIAFNNAYHGSSHGSLSVMGNEYFKNAFRPLLPDVKFINFNNEDDLNQISYKTSCVIVEPIQGEAGVIIPENNFLLKLRKRCNETGTLLIFDEIQTGFGRTGKLFAFEHYSVIPDILLIAKGMAGGMPLGAFISSNIIMKSLTNNPVLGHITTFGGHPVSCAAAIANLSVIIDENLINTVDYKEKLFRKLLNNKKIKKIKGKGLFLALEFENKEINFKAIKNCIKNGVITDWFLFSDNCMRIAPPLIITEEQITESCNVINYSIDE